MAMPSVAEFVQCDSRNYTRGRGGHAVDHAVVHYTGTDANAHNNLIYFSRNSAKASAHYFVDRDGTLRQSVSEADTAWHAGKFAMNQRSVGIECVSAGEDFSEAQVSTLAALVQDLMARYGIPAENVIRHYDVTGKECPAPYLDPDKWRALHDRITGGATAPAAKDEWVQKDGRWWYRHADGSFTKSGWELVSGKWYLFDAEGWMLTGWQRKDGRWYLLGADGAMLTGWQLIDGKWYFLDESGAMATGWRMVGDKWYFLDENGSMRQGWQRSGGKWYWLNADGSMSADEVKMIGGTFYGFDSSGAMLAHSIGLTEQ
ncbi:N-acetylmuramoyl-L-alanine amidase [Paratractidigestivibacter faecalis]|uniref:N-acetylmuramoyl-L-alanine amidase n=1 Tax=Paratractidigestivibacter faecalis TaxID=2292441 RepID=A0ABV1IDM5_9ACTN